MKSLDALKELKKEDYENDNLHLNRHCCYSVIQKSLQALEIIKNKKVNVNCIISGWTLEKYNSYKTHISLTKEEYDLLKEVLC